MDKTIEQLDEIVAELTSLTHRGTTGPTGAINPEAVAAIGQAIESFTRARAIMRPFTVHDDVELAPSE